MRGWKTSVMAIAAMAYVGGASSAHAQVIYSGGATFPSKVYRLLMDCWDFPVDGAPPTGPAPGGTGFLAPLPIAPACPNGPGLIPPAGGNLNGSVGNPPAQILYAPVGSGAGKNAFRLHTVAALGTPAPANTIPYASNAVPGTTNVYPYVRPVHFIGSDDVVNAGDYFVGAASYTGGVVPSLPPAAGSSKALYGEWLQWPALIGPATIALNGKDGLGAALPATVNMSRKLFCGIFSGHINTWANAQFAVDNPGWAQGGPIKVIHRSDSSGTTFITSNALVSQCQQDVFGPDESTGTLVKYSFPWADQTAALAPGHCIVGPPASDVLPIRGANLLGWPDFVGTGGAGTDICGAAIVSPVGSTFLSASGSGGVAALATTTTGSLTYVSPDFVAPVVVGGLQTASLQNQFDINNGTGLYHAPTAAAAQSALSASTPVFPTSADLANPLNWSAQLPVPNPTTAAAYPLSGFTHFGIYQCYASAADLQAIVNFILFHYANQPALRALNPPNTFPGVADAVLASQGFAPIPANWFAEILAQVGTGGSVPLHAGPTAGVCTTGG